MQAAGKSSTWLAADNRLISQPVQGILQQLHVDVCSSAWDPAACWVLLLQASWSIVCLQPAMRIYVLYVCCSISKHDFFFCKTASPGEERTCASSWTMRQGIEALVYLQFAERYPVTERCKPWNPSQPNCISYDCQDVYDGLKGGNFSYVRLESAW